uniref:Zgc:110410 n=1 Tax=Cyprinus carpio TaxID=7962 RepID=A0A8C1STE3_CYPCA
MGIPDSTPPEYTLGFEDENCFSDATIRRGFIRKVYLTLMVQLLITVGIICAFLYWCATFVLIIVLICCCDIRRKVPLNFIFLVLFVRIVIIIQVLFSEAVLWAVGANALVSLAMTLSGTIWVLCWTLFLFALLCAILRSRVNHQLIFLPPIKNAYLFILIHLNFYCLLMDTQLILGGKHKYSINPEEYIFAALNLYLDIITIFLLLLQLIGLCH